eukprot:CAMPEP_0194346934 /NCGR_PEP_ID=MMETSP0171-20130528/105705_1 /TAXON_ID=218684 /ORGANISM="Corethron pennatum, Strain L29A3" /LENGTH=1039 /DNA_ID=CAMNT_0039114119 /DNA_START=132 /DNA_END=3250 /DNA_ORIENTATION=+
MPQILSNNGFVEQYPRRFNIAEDSPVFELDKNEDGEIEITWLQDDPIYEDLDFFRNNHDRLRQMKRHVETSLKELESYEQYTINAYFQAMLEGFELVVQWGKNAVSTYIHPQRYKSIGKQISVGKYQSTYQGIEFLKYEDANGNKLDTCLWFDDYALHACTSLRPHYHEWFVHYPAQFLKQMKRVLFLGGGDSMILHEVLKYPDLELVIGMELDQVVVRGSFKHFKTEPHYDDDRVQWWFGDAARSLKMIPDEYLGTFDLVVVDLLTEVIDILKVTAELNILDFSMLLLNEDGILTMNDEFIVATKSENSQYSVDLEVMDMPVFCQQSIKMLSNSVDFMTAEPIDHGVERIIVKPGVTKKDSNKFDSWWNYHRNIQHTLKERKAMTVDPSNNSQGIMLVLEAEETTLSLDSLTDLNDTLTKFLEGEDLTVLSSLSFKKETLFIALKEGYVTLRSWQEHKYCAFDLVLWSSFDKLDTIKDGLVGTVGAELTSSYKISISGMKGVAAAEIPKFPAGNNSNSSAKAGQHTPVLTAFELGDLNAILKETISVVQIADPITLILCPEGEKPCQSLEALKDVETKVLLTCASGEDTKRDAACENTTFHFMKSATSKSKITAIVIDPAVPSKMGKILKRVLQNPQTSEELLAAQFVLLAPGLDSYGPWYKSLFEWFRTDLAKISPSHHAKVLFSSPTRSGKLRMGIFSAGNADFYSLLVDLTEKCESKYGLKTEIPRVLDGKPKKMTCFNPPFVAKESTYDRSTAESQWESQNPLGMQTVSQFESPLWPLSVGDSVLGGESQNPLGMQTVSQFESPLWPLSVGDSVLGSIDDEAMSGRWYPANITAKNPDNTFDLTYTNGEESTDVERQFIRKLDFAGDLTIEEVVFVRKVGVDFDFFYFGTVLKKMQNKKYKVHIKNDIGLIDDIVDQKDIAYISVPSKVSCTTLKAMLQKAVASTDSTGEDKLEVQGAGDGCIATALWSKGSAVASWDGGDHINLNLFTFEEDKQIHEKVVETFMMNSSFGRVFQNQHPRGSGRVVNFKQEMNS